MRKVYYIADRRKKLRSEALALMRRARRQVDPELLAETRRLIALQAIEQQKASRRDGEIAIDRDKNQATVMKFLELKSEDPGFCRKIETMLLN